MDGPVFVVGDSLAKRINPHLPKAPPGLMGGSRDDLRRRRVTLHFGSLTLKQALDEVSRQVPGVVWGLVAGQNPATGRPECLMRWFDPEGGTGPARDLLGR